MWEFLGEYVVMAREQMETGQNTFEFNLIDISDKHMFNFVRKQYSLGNFDQPGIFATHGPKLFYRNYKTYKGTDSFKIIGPSFL